MLKIGIVGLGSIGKRHLQNIHQVLTKRGSSFLVDVIRRPSSKPLDETIKHYVNAVYTKIEDVPSDYDVLFITNPTHLHYETIKKFKDKTQHMFIEKPIFDDDAYAIDTLNLDVSSVYYVACPLRYTAVIQHVKTHINLAEVYSVRAISSSYLPDWRPGQDYRQTYSAHLNEGGGVSIDLIHEWDYLVHLFGFPLAVHNFRGTLSHLEVDSDDVSIYIARYKDKLIELHLDYIGRSPIRQLELYTKDDTIVIDLIHATITYLLAGKTINFNDDRNAYQSRELNHFFDMIEGKAQNDNTIEIAVKTLKIAKKGTL